MASGSTDQPTEQPPLQPAGVAGSQPAGIAGFQPSGEPAPQAAPEPAAGQGLNPAIDVADVRPDAYGSSADSAYDSEVNSYTTSLASAVTDYKFEMGRRYHAYKEGAYFYPNDEAEQDRLDIQHQMILVSSHGKLHNAPLKDPKRILDIGTGTGIWAIEMGDKFPNAKILGNDLSAVQPRWVPPNVSFEVDDVEADWTYSQKFDFIFCRAMGMGIRNWPRLIQQCYEFTEPGGLAEFIDFDLAYGSPDNTIPKDSVTWKANAEFRKMATSIGVESCPGPHLAKWMKDAGFEDINEQVNPLPIGTWTADKHLKKVGAWNFLQLQEGLESFLYLIFAKHAGYTKEELEIMCAKMRAEIKDPKIHSLFYLHIVYGRKPAEKTTSDI